MENYSEIYVKENNELKRIDPTRAPWSGLYAAMGYNTETAGDLFAVHFGPQLWPAFDADGKRINVGKERAGQAWNSRRGWHNE